MSMSVAHENRLRALLMVAHNLVPTYPAGVFVRTMNGCSLTAKTYEGSMDAARAIEALGDLSTLMHHAKGTRFMPLDTVPLAFALRASILVLAEGEMDMEAVSSLAWAIAHEVPGIDPHSLFQVRHAADLIARNA